MLGDVFLSEKNIFKKIFRKKIKKIIFDGCVD